MHRTSNAEQLRRRRRVEELLHEGLDSTAKIAARLAAEGLVVTERTVRRDIAQTGKEWLASIVWLRDVRQMRIYHGAQRRNAELQQEWERSKRDRERTRIRTRKGPGDEQTLTEVEHVTENRVGDVRLLAEQRKNDELIAKLLGLYEPTTLGLKPADLNREIERELAKLAAGGWVEVAGAIGAAAEEPRGRAA